MNFFRFSSANTARSTMLRWSRLCVAFGIAGLYLSILIAGAFYVSRDEAAIANMNANEILLNGVIISVFLLAGGWALKLLDLADNTKTSANESPCPLLCDSEQA